MAAASACPEAALRGLRPYGVVAFPQWFWGTKFALQSFLVCLGGGAGPAAGAPRAGPECGKALMLVFCLKNQKHAAGWSQESSHTAGHR